MASVRIGVDPGKKGDPAGIVIVEQDDRDHFLVRLIEETHCKYTSLRDRLVEIDGKLESPLYWIESNGVGQAFLDMLRETVLRDRITPVYTTNSDKVSRSSDGGYNIGKGLLITRLTVLLEQTRIHLPDNEQADALIRELEHFGRETSSGGVRHEASEGHDDLVMALALSVWDAQERRTSIIGDENGLAVIPFMGASRQAGERSIIEKRVQRPDILGRLMR